MCAEAKREKSAKAKENESDKRNRASAQANNVVDWCVLFLALVLLEVVVGTRF